MQFYSHPGKYLRNHLREVSQGAVQYCPRQYSEAAYITGITHDFGKFTTYFQDYLLNGKLQGRLQQHGFISALLGAYCALKKWGEDSLYPLVIYSAIYHHHGNLTPYHDIMPDSLRNFGENMTAKLALTQKQIRDITANIDSVKEAYKDLLDEKLLTDFVINFEPELILKKVLKIEYHFSVKGKYKSPTGYFLHQFIYSSLIAADKMSAAGINLPQIKYISCADLISGKNSLLSSVNCENSDINRVRQDIYECVLTSMDKQYNANRVFTITSPTGSGKTLAGFCAAAKLRDRLGGDRKIIYVLPFTSIIDQNYNTIHQLFGHSIGLDNIEETHLIKHHHLSTSGKGKKEQEKEYFDYSYVIAELLTENWDSGVIVTTFVQFFESIIGNRNRMLKKLHNYENAIFLIDEIQALDIRYYPLVEYVLGILCQEFDSRIILMTATKPVIFSNDNSTELLENYVEYYRYFNRTVLIPVLEKKSIDNFVDEIVAMADVQRSCLIVCNTIQSSLDVYNKLNQKWSGSRPVYYLSTNLVPAQRRDRIAEVARVLKSGVKPVLVSTQVVEAGVDLDFDIVVRDFAPLDSIIQCAGRCNRNGHDYKKGHGDVYIYNIVNDDGKSLASYIYGNTNLIITRELLEGKQKIAERDYLELINQYFVKVKDNISQKESQDLIDALEKFDLSYEGVGGFSLIKDNPGYIDVLFRLNEDVEKAYQQYWTLKSIDDFQERRNQYLQIKNILQNYTISMPEKYITCFETRPFGSNTDEVSISLPPEGVADYYDFKTGFKRIQKENYLFF